MRTSAIRRIGSLASNLRNAVEQPVTALRQLPIGAAAGKHYSLKNIKIPGRSSHRPRASLWSNIGVSLERLGDGDVGRFSSRIWPATGFRGAKVRVQT